MDYILESIQSGKPSINQTGDIRHDYSIREDEDDDHSIHFRLCGDGRDVFAGGPGNDRLIGGAEGETFFGQGGSDTFVIRGGVNWIMDFDSSDKISIGMNLSQVQNAATQRGDHLHIELPGGDLYLANTILSDIEADNLIV